MAQATLYFPRGFLWGTATAAHQVEGNNNNNSWSAWEKEPRRIMNGDKAGLACDWWGGRWKEDFDRAAEAGQNAHRMSVEWSRIQPAPDRWDESALEYYREMVRGLLERDMLPLVTLHHFSEPLWLAEKGYWESADIVEAFTRYVTKVVEALGDYVTYWVTINEPNVFMTLGYLLGIFPPGKKSLGAMVRTAENIARSHAAAYDAIHKLQPQSRVGYAIFYRGFSPRRNWSPLDRVLTSAVSKTFNDLFPTAAATGRLRFPLFTRRIQQPRETQDFLGLNYYTCEQIAFAPTKPGSLFMKNSFPPGSELSDQNFIANYPLGMSEAIHWALRFNKPILITENGIENREDSLRRRYIVQHLHRVWREVNSNTPIKGYFHWTLVDNFEWDRGWTQRFGLWELDEESQARRKRPSVDLYAEICKSNSLSSEIVARYTPELFETMFPN